MDDSNLESILAHDSEIRTVDYKRAIPWIKGERERLIKDFIAMANAGGGFIVVGVDESAKDEHDRFGGVPQDMLASWETTQVSTVTNLFCSPPINVEIRKFESKKYSQTFVILRIPRHGRTPHVCIKDYCTEREPILQKGQLYFRTKNKESARISDPSDWDDVLQRCITARTDDLRELFEQVLRGVQARPANQSVSKRDPFAEMDQFRNHSTAFEVLPAGMPAVFFEVLALADVPLIVDSPDILLPALDHAMVDHQGWPFLFIFTNSRCDYQTTDTGYFAVDNKPFKTDRFNYWHFDYTTQTFYTRMLTYESMLGVPKVFQPLRQARLMAETAEAVGRLFDALGYPSDTEITIAVRYSPVSGMQCGSIREIIEVHSTSSPFSGDVLTLSKMFNLLSLVTQPAAAAASTTQRLMQKLNCGQLPSVKFLEKVAADHLAKIEDIPLGMRLPRPPS